MYISDLTQCTIYYHSINSELDYIDSIICTNTHMKKENTFWKETDVCRSTAKVPYNTMVFLRIMVFFVSDEHCIHL